MAKKTTAEQYVGHDRAPRYRTVALHALASLSAGDRRPKTLHRLRTHLRRLQAYLELVGEEDTAAIIADCCSRFSRLRTLHVFEQYLAGLNAPDRDRRLVNRRIRTLHDKLNKNRTYEQVERLVERHALPPSPARFDWMGQRLVALRRRQADLLRTLLAKTGVEPRRKALHALRLTIKSLRYQEEWALGEPYARSDLFAWLKWAQTALGQYEELAQFRKLAAKLDLASRPLIERDWRRARTKARALPALVSQRIRTMTTGHLWLLPSRHVPLNRQASAS